MTATLPINPKYAQHFDFYLESDDEQMALTVCRFEEEILSHLNRGRGLTESQSNSFRISLRALLLNIVYNHVADPNLSIIMRCRSNYYSSQSRYQRAEISHAHLIEKSMHPLVKLGYLDIVEGEIGRGLSTVVRATPKLLSKLAEHFPEGLPYVEIDYRNAETIILKDDNKQRIDYSDTDHTNTMRSNLLTINSALDAAHINLFVTDDELQEYNKRRYAAIANDASDEQEESYKPPVNFSKKYLHRVFNDGRAEFDRGGRFYGAWWEGIESKYRRFITINSKPTVELDYQAIHPSLLYAHIGEKWDPNDDAYRLEHINPLLTPDFRKTYKIQFQRLLNAKANIAPRQLPPLPPGIDSLEPITVAFSEMHAPVADYFFQGIGKELQYRDAQIAEQVMLRMLEQGYVVLAVHDSFIVQTQAKDILKETMRESFKDVMQSSAAPEKPDEISEIDHELYEQRYDLREYNGYCYREQLASP